MNHADALTPLTVSLPKQKWIQQAAKPDSFFTFIFLKHVLVRLEILQFVCEHIRSRSVAGHWRSGRGWSFTGRTGELKPDRPAPLLRYRRRPASPPRSANRPMSATSSAASAAHLSRAPVRGDPRLSFTVSQQMPNRFFKYQFSRYAVLRAYFTLLLFLTLFMCGQH